MTSSDASRRAAAGHRRRETCRLCGSRHVEVVVPLHPTYLPERYVDSRDDTSHSELYPIDLFMCLDCGHVQILDVVDPDRLWSGYTYHSGQNRSTLQHFQEVADRVVMEHALQGGLAVDIGSNDGSLLRCFQQHGFEALGIDPAAEIAAQATRAGVPTIDEYASVALSRRIRQRHGAASVVTAFNVFAHSDDMGEMADSVRELLAPDGLFVCEVSYLLDIIDKMLLGTIFHEHLCHHSLRPLIRFLKSHQLEVIDVSRCEVQGGSLVVTAQPTGGPQPVRPSVAELLELESQRGLDRPEAVREFAGRLQRLQQQTAELLRQWQSEGATIAAYGAARSGPTLIAQFQLGDAISCIFDDHPQKVNKFTNGDRIPVVPTSELLRRQPDYVILLAWIHADKIVASNLEYLRRGGRFVLCCPEVRVIGIEEAGARGRGEA